MNNENNNNENNVNVSNEQQAQVENNNEKTSVLSTVTNVATNKYVVITAAALAIGTAGYLSWKKWGTKLFGGKKAESTGDSDNK